jgi:transposase
MPKRGSVVYKDPSALKEIKKEPDHFVAANMFEAIRERQEIKDSYEERFATLAKQWPVIDRLCTIPGIAAIRASIITAIICSPERFANKHKLWAYAMLVRYVDESDGKIYGSRVPLGRRELKYVFMGAAASVLETKSGLRRYYDRLRAKGIDGRKAKQSVARRIAAIALTCMKTGAKYDDHYDEKGRRLESDKA